MQWTHTPNPSGFATPRPLHGHVINFKIDKTEHYEYTI